MDSESRKIEIATLGAGCFWCVEAQFTALNGVLKVTSGYSGGHVKDPSYKEVCTGDTGHAEVVQVEFVASVISFEEILEAFFYAHDPTQLNRQGNDVGTQYRSVIYYHDEHQKESAETIIQRLNNENVYPDPVVTQVAPFDTFYSAETYHHNYFALNPDQQYCAFVVRPKVEKFKKIFHHKLKNKEHEKNQ